MPDLALHVRDAYHPVAMQPDVMKGLAATPCDMIQQKRAPPGTMVEQFVPDINLLPGAAP